MISVFIIDCPSFNLKSLEEPFFRKTQDFRKFHQKKYSNSCKVRAFQGIGDVVYVNVYESFSKKLDQIEEKLDCIEKRLDKTDVNKKIKTNMSSSLESTPSSVHKLNIQSKGVDYSRKMRDLEAQIADATSDARKNALRSRLMELSAK